MSGELRSHHSPEPPSHSGPVFPPHLPRTQRAFSVPDTREGDSPGRQGPSNPSPHSPDHHCVEATRQPTGLWTQRRRCPWRHRTGLLGSPTCQRAAYAPSSLSPPLQPGKRTG